MATNSAFVRQSLCSWRQRDPDFQNKCRYIRKKRFRSMCVVWCNCSLSSSSSGNINLLIVFGSESVHKEQWDAVEWFMVCGSDEPSLFDLLIKNKFQCNRCQVQWWSTFRPFSTVLSCLYKNPLFNIVLTLCRLHPHSSGLEGAWSLCGNRVVAFCWLLQCVSLDFWSFIVTFTNSNRHTWHTNM